MTDNSKARANVQANRSKQYLDNYDLIFGPKSPNPALPEPVQPETPEPPPQVVPQVGE